MTTAKTQSTLSAALSKAQAVLEGAKKDAVNPHLRNKYADLASCWDACRKALTENELSITQTTTVRDGVLLLVTTLHHSSGESVFGELPVIYEGTKGLNTMQAMGSALTYARRYGLCAIVGISPEDDDGANAGQGQQQRHAQQKPVSRLIGTDEATHLKDLISETETDPAKFLDYFRVTEIGDMSIDQYEKAVKQLRKKQEQTA